MQRILVRGLSLGNVFAFVGSSDARCLSWRCAIESMHGHLDRRAALDIPLDGRDEADGQHRDTSTDLGHD